MPASFENGTAEASPPRGAGAVAETVLVLPKPAVSARYHNPARAARPPFQSVRKRVKPPKTVHFIPFCLEVPG